MGQVEDLVKAYERFVSLPWQAGISGPEKVWFVLYPPAEERRLRTRLGEFELATKKAGHGWTHIDLTESFAQWMAAQDYRESYFDSPEDLQPYLGEFTVQLAGTIRADLAGTDPNGIFAISGVASLFGVTRVSEVMQAVADDIRGRLVLFFPGERDGSSYRLLDAREGWNYLAVPITAGRMT